MKSKRRRGERTDGFAQGAEHMAPRQRYGRLEIDYWHAVESSDPAPADALARQARASADGLERPQAPS